MQTTTEYGSLARDVQPRPRPDERSAEEYLFSSPANAERLMRAYRNSLAGRNMTSMSIEELEALVKRGAR